MTFNPPDDDDGLRGYGQPPKANQFKPGQSGNPKGRPKETKNQTFHDTIRKRLQEPMSLTIGGKRRTMSRIELIVTQLMNKAAKGDLKATQTLIKLENSAPPPDRAAELLGAADRLRNKFQLIRERKKCREHDGQEGQAGREPQPASVTKVEVERPGDASEGNDRGNAALQQQALDTSTPAGKALLQMSGVFAEFERAMIVERTKAGLERARARGAQIGRPPVTDGVVDAIRSLRAQGLGKDAIARTLRYGKGVSQRVCTKFDCEQMEVARHADSRA